jgi:hypothetical protein
MAIKYPYQRRSSDVSMPKIAQQPACQGSFRVRDGEEEDDDE